MPGPVRLTLRLVPVPHLYAYIKSGSSPWGRVGVAGLTGGYGNGEAADSNPHISSLSTTRPASKSRVAFPEPGGVRYSASSTGDSWASVACRQ
jgi:hypothetical protein